ncbi:3-isopropylmalate dehydratase small subunit, partial [Bacillus sp. SIMBA_161]
IRHDSDVWKPFVASYGSKGYEMTVDLEQQQIRDHEGKMTPFEVAPHWREMLLNGYAEISLTLLSEDDIQAFEEKRSS